MVFESMTNEEMVKKFSNQFDLVNYAIKVAELGLDAGDSGEEGGNRALQVLKEIISGKERIEENCIDGKEKCSEDSLTKAHPVHEKKSRAASGEEPLKPSKSRAQRKQVQEKVEEV
jgi:DNA-directed RNA polymerase subunit omega